MWSIWASRVAQTVKNLPAMQETQGSIPGLGRSHGEGSGYPLFLLREPHGQGSLAGGVHGVTKSHT